VILYLNASVVGSAGFSGGVQGGALYIGAIGPGSTTTWIFNGGLDEVRYYTRGLTAAEITDLYNNYGYVTTNYPGRELVRRFQSPEPATSVGTEASGSGLYPVLTANSACRSLTVDSGASLGLSSYALSVYGSFTNNGTLTAGTGTMSFAGTDAVANTIGGTTNSTFFILEVLRTAGTLTLARNITINSAGGGRLSVGSGGNVGIQPGAYQIYFGSGGPWLTGWTYRKPITITNGGGATVNYQVLITTDTATLVSQGKMRADGGDIRFTDSDGLTLVGYWVDSGINTVSTRIWVSVPSLPSGGYTIYMYYGNPAATSLSADTIFDNVGNDLTGSSVWSATYTGNCADMTFPYASRSVKWRIYAGSAATIKLKTTDSAQIVTDAPASQYGLAVGWNEIITDIYCPSGGHPGWYSVTNLPIGNAIAGTYWYNSGDMGVGLNLPSTGGSWQPSIKVWVRRFQSPEPTTSVGVEQ
jgi:hypothetical protein